MRKKYRIQERMEVHVQFINFDHFRDRQSNNQVSPFWGNFEFCIRYFVSYVFISLP